MNSTLAPHDIHRLLTAEHDDPFGILGIHNIDGLWVVRAFRPDAKELLVIDRQNPGRHFPANRIASEGLFEAQLIGEAEEKTRPLARLDILIGDVVNLRAFACRAADVFQHLRAGRADLDFGVGRTGLRVGTCCPVFQRRPAPRTRSSAEGRSLAPK